VRNELDSLWAAVQEGQSITEQAKEYAADASTRAAQALQKAEAAAAQAGISPSNQVIGGMIDPNQVAETLMGTAAFRRRVAEDFVQLMSGDGFVTEDQLMDKLREAAAQSAADWSLDLSGMSARVAKVEQDLFKPQGVVDRLQDKIKFLEDKRVGRAIERGGKVFRDQQSVKALCQAVGAGKLKKYCVDAVSLLMLAEDPYETVAEGMATEAAAFKAQYASLLEGRLAVSFGLTFPENIMERTKSKKGNVLHSDGWTWTTAWATFESFEGTFQDGASQRMKTSLMEVRDMIKNAINFAYPNTEDSVVNLVLIDQLDKSYEQACGWLESLAPLYKTMKKGNMSSPLAWHCCLVFTKALFEDIKTVRHVSAERDEAAMIWGSLRTTELLQEYVRLKFVQHPQVSSILALTAMQREGKDMATVEEKVAAADKKVDSLESRLKKCEDWQDKILRKNPSLSH
jgi:hypothetical protein